MCMNGNEVHSCDECNTIDYDQFMVKRGEYWFCKECDPGPEPEPDSVDYAECHRNGGWR